VVERSIARDLGAEIEGRVRVGGVTEKAEGISKVRRR